MKNLLIALSIAVLGASLVGSSARAQQRGFASAPAGRGGAPAAQGRSARTGGGRQGRGRRPMPGWGYGPYFYSDLGYDSGLSYDSFYGPEVPPPQIVSGGPFQAAALPAPPKPAGGLELLELQGDHLVRITPNSQPQTAGKSSRPQPEKAANLPAAAPRAVLVFRDGHNEEIGKYCIMGGNIRIDTDYWSTGSWTKTVHISDLDVAATMKLNQERGSHFRLPSGPYEVMIGE